MDPTVGIVRRRPISMEGVASWLYLLRRRFMCGHFINVNVRQRYKYGRPGHSEVHPKNPIQNEDKLETAADKICDILELLAKEESRILRMTKHSSVIRCFS